MEIIEYKDEYSESVKDLLVELQEYIASIDKESYNIVTKEFREEAFKKTMEEVSEYKGKIFLAKDNNQIIGMIIGLINNEETRDYDFKAPKRGRVLELIVSKKIRSKGIGNKLLEKMEDYFKSVGCKGILIDVFAYNEIATNFYIKKGYFNRSIEMMKKI